MLNPKEHKENWNDTANYYAHHMENASLPVGLTLSRMVRIEEAKNIVEIGSGSGVLTTHWLKNLPDGVKYTSVDLSEEMVKIANRRKEEQKHKLNNIQHEFVVGDAHDLSFIPDQSIDAYLGPLVYCHLSDPSKALKEAMRILKKGGKLGVSMGTPVNSTFATYIKTCHAKISQEGGQSQDNQHQHEGQHHDHGHGHGHDHQHQQHDHQNHDHDHGHQNQHQHQHHHTITGKDHFLKLVREAGFEVDFCWDQEIIIDVLDEKNASELWRTPGSYEVYNGLSEDQKQKFVENLKTEFAKVKKTNIPLKISTIQLTATKL